METEPGTNIELDAHGRRKLHPGQTKIEPVMSRQVAIAEFDEITTGCYSVDDDERSIERDKYVEARLSGKSYTPSRFKDPTGLVRVKETGKRLAAEYLADDGKPQAKSKAEIELDEKKERFRKHEQVLEQQRAVEKRNAIARRKSAYHSNPINAVDYDEYNPFEGF